MQPSKVKLPVRPGRIDLVDSALQPVMSKLKGATGILNLLVQTPGCALTVNENCDASVRSDMLAALDRLAPGGTPEAAELKALLYGKSLTLPVSGGRMQFGTWQGVYLCGFGSGAAEAEVTATFVPSSARASGFTFTANRRASHRLDEKVSEALPQKADGVLLVHEQHTSASLAVAAGDADLEPGMSSIIPESWNREFFTHTMEGDDDMPGHLKSSLLGCSVAVPVEAGQLRLGRHQGLLLNEHRNAGGWGGGHSRKVSCVMAPAAGPLQTVRCEASQGGAVRDVTQRVQEALAVREGVAVVMSQEPSVGVAVCSEAGAAAMAAATSGGGALGAEACGAAIVGCSKVLPVARGQLQLAQGTGVFLVGGAACDLVVAGASVGDNAASL